MQVISVNHQYASGFRRLAAFILDRIIISIVVSIIFRFFFGWSFDFPFDNGWNFVWFSENMWSWITLHGFLREVIFITYYSLMESSKYQGTLGKIIMGIRVIGMGNERITLGKAILRNLSKILSAMILGIGYIMIIFDNRKQGLHDKIADTLVVRQ